MWLSVWNRLEGNKVHFWKQLILCNLTETYLIFKKQKPEMLLGFSKFAELWPKNCVLTETCGACKVCVCVYVRERECDAYNFTSTTVWLTEAEENPLKNIQRCLSKIITVLGTSYYLGEHKM